MTEVTKERSWVDEFLAVDKNWSVYEQERLALDFSDVIRDRLEAQSVPQTVVASRLNKSPAVISRALSKGSNMTLRTLVEIAAAVGLRILGFQVQPIPDAVTADWWTTVPHPQQSSEPSKAGDSADPAGINQLAA